jgi:hypothetical protein
LVSSDNSCKQLEEDLEGADARRRRLQEQEAELLGAIQRLNWDMAVVARRVFGDDSKK